MNGTTPTEAARLFAALSDPTRLRLLLALRGGELCACQLIELVGLAPSTVSKHLALLRAAGLVAARKDGRWVHYRLAVRPDFPMVGSRAPALFQGLEKSPDLRADERRLKALRKADLDYLCKTQRKN
jgi:ArsR family transcriptional regulator